MSLPICIFDSLGYVHIKLLLHTESLLNSKIDFIHWFHHTKASKTIEAKRRKMKSTLSLASDTAAVKVGIQSSTIVPPATRAV